MEHARTYMHEQGHAGVCRSVQEHARVSKDMWEHARACKSTHMQERTCRSVHMQERTCKRMRGGTGEHARPCKRRQEHVGACKSGAHSPPCRGSVPLPASAAGTGLALLSCSRKPLGKPRSGDLHPNTAGPPAGLPGRCEQAGCAELRRVSVAHRSPALPSRGETSVPAGPPPCHHHNSRTTAASIRGGDRAEGSHSGAQGSRRHVFRARALADPLNLPLPHQRLPNSPVWQNHATAGTRCPGIIIPPARREERRECRGVGPAVSILQPGPGQRRLPRPAAQRRESALPGKGLAPCRRRGPPAESR